MFSRLDQSRVAQGERALTSAWPDGDAISHRSGGELIKRVGILQIEPGLFGILSQHAIAQQNSQGARD